MSERGKYKELDISSKNLAGILNLSDFINLEKLNCSRNYLTSLELNKCEKLVEIDCCYNLLDDLDFLKKLPNPKKLSFLDLNGCGVFLSLEEIEKILTLFNLVRRGENSQPALRACS